MVKSEFMSATRLSSERKKIIYVDDMNYSLISLKKGLGSHYEVYLAESAEKMYKIMENVTPDLILLDVNMPDIDGYETIKSLKANERYCEIPVIFFTSDSSKENVKKGLSLGAVDYVIKPFNADKLIESIQNQFNPKKGSGKNEEKSIFNPNILVVDDMSSMLRTIHHALHDNYNVFLLSKAEVVIDFLMNNKPDLILLDYLMPGMSGFDLIPQIRDLSGYKDIPIIMVTTEGTFRNVNDAIALGASDFIVKPFDPRELNYKVDRHIRLMKQQRENEENAFLLS
ncbi:MAG: response regulator [Treponema sp.]|nr:response regulator [Treponema sp.]MCL2271451.1 response regulator [Treponema sp.]